MIVGVDFDNTIVDYTGVFHAVGVESGCIPKSVGLTKAAVKKYLCDQNRENEWTKLQGIVYGSGILNAKPYPGVCHVIREMIQRDIDVFVISHKTAYPILGNKVSLHESAMKWLVCHDIAGKDIYKIPSNKIFFNETQKEKIQKISQLKCDFFIDDLSTIFKSADFPRKTKGFFFNTSACSQELYNATEVRSWLEIGNEFGIK
ncbi:hypothetical protein N9W66_10885 [Luminiphilus sp.]|nr:hypothetical protein [Luminiphilus sp.]